MAPFRLRLRLTFSTLLVIVTIIGGWLGYHVNWIRQRHEARRVGLSLSKMGFSDNAPWQLRWLGESGLRWAAADEPNASRLRELFPEANIQVVDWSK